MAEENKYIKVVHVDSNVLSQWLVHYGNLNYFYGIFKHKDFPKNYFLDWIYLDGDVLYSNKDVKLWESIVLKRKAEFIKFILDMIKDKIKNIDRAIVSKKGLMPKMSELFKFGACTVANGLLESSCHVLARKIFSKYGLSQKEQASVLYENLKKTEMILEFEDMSRIMKNLKNKYRAFDRIDFKDEKISGIIENHLKKYAFLGMNYFGGKPWNEEDIKKRIKEKWDEKTNKVSNSSSNFKFEKEDRNIIELIKEVIYLRTERNEHITYACYSLLEELKKRASQLSINYGDIIFLTPDEILENKANMKKINQRKNGFAMFVKNKRIKISTGKKLIKLKGILHIDEKASEIKGLVVSPGKIRGTVQIIKENTDFSLFKPGNILVAKYTTPSFTPVMQKASAIITDIGGLTSHAAIISRELGIPCIVGVKNATKTLKDGDIIEVDANNGIVRKIKND